MRARRGALALFLFLLLALPAAADNPLSPGLDGQRRAAQGLEPAALEPPGLGGPRVATVKIRFYADDDYRAGLFRWAERVRAQLSQLNQFVEPGFGIRFEPESFRRWHRTSKTSDIREILAELEQQDQGQGIDWVVGFVTPLPLVSASIHELGAARILGKHFVMRGMASAEEARALDAGFDRMDKAEREELYGRRKWHKETVIFLHEWLHTLGAFHSSEAQRIMHPSYTNRMRNVSSEDAQLAVTALRARLQARGSETVDYSQLRGYVERTTLLEWQPKERQELLDALIKGGARPWVPPPVVGVPLPPGMPPEEQKAFDRAVELVQEKKGEEAWPLVAPLGAKYPARLQVQRLLCRLAYLPAAAEAGAAACGRARELAPADPDPLIDEAQARIQRQEYEEALALIDGAAVRAAKLPTGRGEIWLWIARLYGQLGALTRAEEAAARAEGAPAKDLEALRASIARDRVFLGPPMADGKPALPPEREAAYADHVRRAQDLLSARKLREAREAVAKGLGEFPGAPGLEVIACEVEMRQRRGRQAEALCSHALSVNERLPRAHYLVGHIRLSSGQRDAAIASFRKSLALDPQERGTWETLADVYRMAGKRTELAQLRADYEKAFGKPLR